jgi:hypothetical protein
MMNATTFEIRTVPASWFVNSVVVFLKAEATNLPVAQTGLNLPCPRLAVWPLLAKALEAYAMSMFAGIHYAALSNSRSDAYRASAV